MRDKITATDGYILTNGEVYGAEVYLGDGVRAEEFYEITVEEYQALLEQETDKVV